MTVRETLVRNTVWYGIVTFLGLGSGLLMSVILARGLGPERMGDYSYILWVSRVMATVATLGFAVATVRYTAAYLGRGEPEVAKGFLTLLLRRQVIYTAIVVAVALPAIVYLAPPSLRGALLVCALGLFPITLESTFTHAVYGAQRYDLTTRVSTLKMSLHLLSAAVVVLLGGDVLGLSIGLMLGTSITAFVQRRSALGLYPRQGHPVPPPALVELREYLVPLSIVTVLDALVWDRSEVFFLRLYTSSQDIAFYSLAFGLASRLMVIPFIVAGALMPALSTLHGAGNTEEFGRVYRRALHYAALVGAPLAAVGWALAPGLIGLLYGDAYRPVAWLLGPLLAVSVVGVMRQVAWAALRATGDRKWTLHATWSSAVVNLAAAAVLVPSYGTAGAVAANAAAQLLASLLAFIGVSRRQGCGFPVLAVVKTWGAAAVGLAVTLALVRTASDLPEIAAAGLTGATVFLAAAIFGGMIGAQEWRLLDRLLGQARRRLPPVSPRLQKAGLIGLGVAGVLGFALVYGPVARALVALWLRVPYYSYAFFVPLFVGWAIWDARRSLTGPPAWAINGALVAVVGVVLFTLGYAEHSLTLKALSLPVFLGGLALFVLGPERVTAVRFPLLFLLFITPFPDGALDALSLPLQHLAAQVANMGAHALGVPTVREGLSLHLPQVTIEVTEACNGLRFLLAMIVLGSAFAWTTQRGGGRRVAVVILAVAIAVVANLFRVTGTAWLAYHYGREAAEGVFHLAYGKAVYFGMLIPFLVAVLLLRRHPTPPDTATR
jgi:exosortase